MIITVYCQNIKSTQKVLSKLYGIKNENPLVISNDLKLKLSKYSGIESENIIDLMNKIAEMYWLRKTQVYFENMYENMLTESGDNV